MQSYTVSLETNRHRSPPPKVIIFFFWEPECFKDPDFARTWSSGPKLPDPPPFLFSRELCFVTCGLSRAIRDAECFLDSNSWDNTVLPQCEHLKNMLLVLNSCPPFSYTLLPPPPYQPLCFMIFRTGFYSPFSQASRSLGVLCVCIILVCL